MGIAMRCSWNGCGSVGLRPRRSPWEQGHLEHGQRVGGSVCLCREVALHGASQCTVGDIGGGPRAATADVSEARSAATIRHWTASTVQASGRGAA